MFTNNPSSIYIFCLGNVENCHVSCELGVGMQLLNFKVIVCAVRWNMSALVQMCDILLDLNSAQAFLMPGLRYVSVHCMTDSQLGVSVRVYLCLVITFCLFFLYK